MKRHVKRLVAASLSVLIMGLIVYKVGARDLAGQLAQTRPGWFLAALACFIPQTLIQIWRWRTMVRQITPLGWGESTRLILAAHTMNILLPSKMGDMTKAWFLSRDGRIDGMRATHLVIFEKMLDLASLSLLMTLGVAGAVATGLPSVATGRIHAAMIVAAGLGLMIVGAVTAIYTLPLDKWPILRRTLASPGAEQGKLGTFVLRAHEVMELLRARRARRGRIVAVSIALWMLHLLQIYWFFLSLGAETPLMPFACLMPLAIFFGLLPLSLWGLGTRDAAMIALFAPWQPQATMAACGIYVSLRYIIPAIAGLPFLHRSMTNNKGHDRST